MSKREKQISIKYAQMLHDEYIEKLEIIKTIHLESSSIKLELKNSSRRFVILVPHKNILNAKGPLDVVIKLLENNKEIKSFKLPTTLVNELVLLNK